MIHLRILPPPKGQTPANLKRLHRSFKKEVGVLPAGAAHYPSTTSYPLPGSSHRSCLLTLGFLYFVYRTVTELQFPVSSEMHPGIWRSQLISQWRFSKFASQTPVCERAAMKLMLSKKQLSIVAISLLAVVIVTGLTLWGRTEKAQDFLTAKVERGSIRNTA